MIEKISKVECSIQSNSSSDRKIEKTLVLGADGLSSFFVTDSRVKQKLILDFTDEESYRLKPGNSYLIITKFYYKDGGVEHCVAEGNSTSAKSFTTILSL